MKSLKTWQIAGLLGALAALVVIVKYGVSVFPSWVYLYDIALNWQDPSGAPTMVPPADYLQPNFSLAWIAGLFGFLTPSSFFVFHLLVTLVAVMLPFWMPRVRSQGRTARLVFILIVGSPVAAILVMWSNGYDALSVIGLTIGALAGRPWISALGWLLVSFNHPQIGFLGFVGWAVVVLVRPMEIQRWWRLGLGALAVGTGWLTNELLMQAWGGYTSRSEWPELVGMGGYWGNLWPAMPIVLFGSAGIVWLILLHPQVRNRLWAQVVMVQAIATPVIISGFTLDATRVSGLILFAPLLAAVTAVASELDDDSCASMWRWWAMAAVIIPVPLVFSGALYHVGWTGFAELDSSLIPPDWYEPLP